VALLASVNKVNTERKFHEDPRSKFHVPGSVKARERKGRGANWPGSYWLIRFGERIGPRVKRLSTGGGGHAI